MKNLSLTPSEYYLLAQMTKDFITIGVKGGLVIIQAKIELLKQLGYV